ncbi:hypothetical protein ACQPW1_22460 [Nocardia sp. CA-128927]|uniref:hypothetical protein n=1 Tax=Nocardia sp. CA-128927 TaxID=3239975 RepID=UPI003D96E197
MSWLEQPRGYLDPRYYRDANSDIERQLRADYARYHTLRNIAEYGEGPEGKSQLKGYADQAAATWRDHELPQWRTLWEQLEAATDAWDARPETTRLLFDRVAQSIDAGDLGVDEMTWRTLRQAREVTGHTDGVAYGSTQDQAHWRAPGPQLRSITNSPDTEPGAKRTVRTVDNAQPLSAVDRSLGATPGAKLLSLAEVDAVIAGTDAVLGWEETDATLMSPRVRDARISYSYTEIADQQTVHAALLREVQNLAAEHTRLADDWPVSSEARQGHIERLERLLAGLNQARLDALDAGVNDTDIEAARRAGLEGIRWSDKPAHAQLGQIEQLTAQRDAALSDAAHLREEIESLRHQLEHRTPGAETEVALPVSTAAPVGSAIGAEDSGGAIDAAIDAALPESSGAEWDPPASAEPLESTQQAELGQELNL